MKYEFSEELQKNAEEISKMLFPHVDVENVKCFRSTGTSSRGTIARCHALGKVMQKAMNRKAFYALEFLSERFDKLSDEEKTKTIIHELMHIPKCFGGGFKHHNLVHERSVNNCYREYQKRKQENEYKNKQQIL